MSSSSTLHFLMNNNARYIKAVHPDWDIKKDMFGIGYDKCDNCTRGFTTENAIMRLVFHDCVRYTDGTGGCDGCLNWGGVGDPHPNPNNVTNTVEYFQQVHSIFKRAL